MKHFFFVLIYLWSFHSIFSQELIVDSGVVLKKGVYKNFEEFKYNSPSLDYSVDIETRTDKYGGLKSDKYITYYGIGKTLEGDIKTRSVYGFSDGSKVYLNLSGLSLTSKDFVELEHLGRYCYYKLINNDMNYFPVYGGAIGGAIAGAMSASFSSTHVEEILDINDGSVYNANKKTFEKLFPNHDIEQDLRLITDNYFVFGQLIKKYNLNLTEEISRIAFTNEKDLFQLLTRIPTDSSVEEYFKRVEDFKQDSRIKEIEFIRKEYKNGNPKTLGIWASHKMGNNSDFLYDIGTWHHYHKNGQLAEVINYNLVGEKNGAQIKYNEEGEVIEELFYSNGQVISNK